MSDPNPPNDPERINPFDVLGFEADVIDLLGTQGTTSHEGGPTLISYEEAQSVRQSVIADLVPHVQPVTHHSSIEPGETYTVLECTPPDDLIQHWDEGLTAGALGLADGTLDGRLLSAFASVTYVLRNGWYTDERKPVRLAEGPISNKARAVHALVYAIAMLEGNHSPNDLGYKAHEGLSLIRKYEIVAENLQEACDAAQEDPSMFGDPQTTADIIDRIVDRAELNRPTFMGRVVGDPFPIMHPN